MPQMRLLLEHSVVRYLSRMPASKMRFLRNFLAMTSFTGPSVLALHVARFDMHIHASLHDIRPLCLAITRLLQFYKNPAFRLIEMIHPIESVRRRKETTETESVDYLSPELDRPIVALDIEFCPFDHIPFFLFPL